MLQAVINIFKIPELRNRVLFTLGILAIYRMGFWIPIPGIDQGELVKLGEQMGKSSYGAYLLRLAKENAR